MNRQSLEQLVAAIQTAPPAVQRQALLQLKAMMQSCNQMMARIDAMSSPKKALRPTHEKR